MVQCCLPLRILLLPDLLGQGGGEVLPHDLVALFVTLVVFVNCNGPWGNN